MSDGESIAGREREVTFHTSSALTREQVEEVFNAVYWHGDQQGAKQCKVLDGIDALRATIEQQAQELERLKREFVNKDQIIASLAEQLAASQARCREMEAKRFPIMRGPSVPWEVMSPHESMAQKNHSQTLHKLAERGGLAPGEAWCVVSGIQYGIASKEQWQLWDAEWFKYAEQVNLHYSKLAQLQATLAAREAELVDIQIESNKRVEQLERSCKDRLAKGLQLEAERDAAVQDAQRYRYLRAHAAFNESYKHRITWFLPRCYQDTTVEDQLDKDLDEAIRLA